MTLGIENHDRFPAATLRDMIEAAGTERIGVCLDTANSLGAGEGLEAVVSVLAPLVVNLHVKDFHIARLEHLMGFTVTGRPAGAGMLNVPWLLARLEAAPRCRTAVLEYLDAARAAPRGDHRQGGALGEAKPSSWGRSLRRVDRGK